MSDHTRRRLGAAAAILLVLAVVGLAVYDPAGETPKEDLARSSLQPISPRVAGDRGGSDVAGRRDAAPVTVASEGREPVVVDRPTGFVPDQLIVRFRADATEEQRAEARRSVGAASWRKLPMPDSEVLELGEGRTVPEAQGILAVHPAVSYAEPDHIYRTSATIPNDRVFAGLWGLQNSSDTDVDAPETWTVTTGSPEVEVGIVDTGVAYDHPDLSGNIWTNPGESGGGRETNGVDDDGNGYIDDFRGWDWVQRDNDPRDLNGHGTHVAGTVGAEGNNSIGVTGVNWNVSLVPLRVLGADGSGTTSSIASAFSYAGSMGFDVVNASLGGPSSSRSISDAIQQWPDTLFVVAAGNEAANNDEVPAYPCNYTSSNIVCVASMTQTDALSTFSNYGATSVDLAAPGSGIVSTVPAQEIAFTEGFEASFAERWDAEPTWGLGSDGYGSYLADSPDANYAPSSAAAATTRVGADLSEGVACRLRFALRLAVETNDDVLSVEASADGANWTKVGSWTGSSGGAWSQASADISQFDGRSTVLIRFRLTSDGDGTVGEGADVDDLKVVCVGTRYSGEEIATFSGTSMAAPHMAGAAAILRAANPTLGVGALRSALLEGAHPVPALSGKSVTGGRLNLFAALQQVTDVSALPSPTASATPDEPVSETPLPAGGAGGSPTPTPSPSPSPSPSGTTPVAGPSPSPSPSGAGSVSARSVELTLAKHLVASGLLSSADQRCRSDVKVVIKRDGTRVASTRTDAGGRFKVRLKDRPGRYLALVPADVVCERAVDRVRHRHSATASQVGEATDETVTAASTDSSCWTFRPAESAFVELANVARAEAGATSLRLDPELSKVARVHTREMVATGSLAHTSSAQLRSRVTGWTSLGENIAVGQSPAALHQAFMASPLHRANILSIDFRHVGVGAIQKDARVWVTIVFEGSKDPGTTLRMPSNC